MFIFCCQRESGKGGQVLSAAFPTTTSTINVTGICSLLAWSDDHERDHDHDHDDDNYNHNHDHGHKMGDKKSMLTKQVTVAKKSTLTNAFCTVFRDKARGDVRTVFELDFC